MAIKSLWRSKCRSKQDRRGVYRSVYEPAYDQRRKEPKASTNQSDTAIHPTETSSTKS